MAIRLRKVNNTWVALCAFETDPKEDDIYLDDGMHYALTCKFARDWGLWVNEYEKYLVDTQKIRDASIDFQKVVEESGESL